MRVFGRQDENDPLAFRIPHCFLCGPEHRKVIIKVKADTGAVNVLSLNGGGSRGMVPLRFLPILQDSISLPIKVQENFDIGFGSSSGEFA